MSDQIDIKRGLLKEKLGSYQVDPPDKVWDTISGQIGNGRKRRGMYILLLATAASIALAITLGVHFFGPDLPRQQSRSEKLPADEAQTKQIPDSRPEQTRDAAENRKNARQEELKGIGPEQVPETQLAVAKTDTHVLPDMGQLPNSPVNSIPADNSEPDNDPDPVNDSEPVPDAEDSADEKAVGDAVLTLEPDRKRNPRWMVGAAVSPLYSYRDAEAVAMPYNAGESGMMSYSTGVHVRYRRNSRLAFETGIYYNSTGISIGAPGIKVFSQESDNMIFGMGSERADITSVSNSVGNIVAYSGDIYANGYKINAENNGGVLASDELAEIQASESVIQQHLDYLELPFNLRYSVIDRTFELQLVGGMSTNFLVGNSVTVEGPSGKEEIGYLSNVNTVNYSGNAGLGMIYHMGKKLSLSLEPRFRYFLNSVNDASLPVTRPYSLGLYTGLSYTF